VARRTQSSGYSGGEGGIRCQRRREPRQTGRATCSGKRSEAKFGGEGGIRTHVPLRTRRFRGAPVTTTSAPPREAGLRKVDPSLYAATEPWKIGGSGCVGRRILVAPH